MNVESLFRSLRVLWRTDAIIAQMQLQNILTALGLRAFAALVALFGLLMLELAGYFTLVQTWSAAAAALVLGGVNFAVALLILVISSRRTVGRDMALAQELHKSAMNALQSDVTAFQAHFMSKTGLMQSLDASMAELIVPAAGILIKAFKASRKPNPPA